MEKLTPITPEIREKVNQLWEEDPDMMWGLVSAISVKSDGESFSKIWVLLDDALEELFAQIEDERS